MLKLVVSWLVPTDHRRAAGVFLGCSLTMLVVGGAFAARIRIPEQPTHGPGEWDHGSRQQAHALILAHFALIPLLFLVAGVSMTPWLTGRTGVVFPKLLAVNVPIHVAACAAVLVASLADAPESYRDVENRLSRPFALVQASLLLAAINLLVTVLFRKNRHSPEHRSPVLAAAIATASVLVGVTWVVSAGSWMGAAIRILPNERTWNSWENPWPEFERLVSLTAGVLASGVLLQAFLGTPEPGERSFRRWACKWAGFSVNVVGVGYLVGVVYAGLDARWIHEPWQVVAEVPGLLLLTATFVLAAVVAVRRGLVRQPGLALLVFTGMVMVLMGQVIGAFAETDTVEELVQKYVGVRFRRENFLPAAAHARAAAILVTCLVVLLRRTGRSDRSARSETLISIGGLMLIVGSTLAVTAECKAALDGTTSSRWSARHNPTDPLQLAITAAAVLAAVGWLVAAAGIIWRTRQTKGTRN